MTKMILSLRLNTPENKLGEDMAKYLLISGDACKARLGSLC